VNLLRSFGSLLLAEAENRVLVPWGIREWHIGEATSETFEDLLLALLNEEKLHP
jgi:hypothetical protein